MGHQEDIVKTESKIIVIRDTQVILDRDVAELYGVETRDINKAVKNNPKKFPPGYIIELNSSEKQELVENFHRFNTLKHSTVAPHAFTEQGLYMLATILKGDLAISTTIAIIDTFTQLRKLARTIDKVNEDAKEHGILPDKATNPKANSYHVRLDSETDARLSKYCQEHGLSKVEAIRQGVLLLLEKQK